MEGSDKQEDKARKNRVQAADIWYISADKLFIIFVMQVNSLIINIAPVSLIVICHQYVSSIFSFFFLYLYCNRSFRKVIGYN